MRAFVRVCVYVCDQVGGGGGGGRGYERERMCVCQCVRVCACDRRKEHFLSELGRNGHTYARTHPPPPPPTHTHAFQHSWVHTCICARLLCVS